MYLNQEFYHFGSVTTRKNKKLLRNNGKKNFLLKWKFTIEFFVKHYLIDFCISKSNIMKGPLNEFKLTIKKNFNLSY